MTQLQIVVRIALTIILIAIPMISIIRQRTEILAQIRTRLYRTTLDFTSDISWRVKNVKHKISEEHSSLVNKTESVIAHSKSWEHSQADTPKFGATVPEWVDANSIEQSIETDALTAIWWAKIGPASSLERSSDISVLNKVTTNIQQHTTSMNPKSTQWDWKVYQDKTNTESLKKDTALPENNITTNDHTPSPIDIKRAKEKEQQKLKDIRTTALTYTERGNMEQYEKKLIEWLALDPENKEFLERLSDYYFEQWQYVKSMSLLKKLVNQSPEDHKAIWQIWQIYAFQEDYDTAKILIEKSISVKSDNPKYYISLVDVHYNQWDYKGAIKTMEKVLKLRPTNIHYLLSIATLHEEAREPTRAFGYYSKIIELDPMHEIAKNGLKRLW